jgi:hypothetical protein
MTRSTSVVGARNCCISERGLLKSGNDSGIEDPSRVVAKGQVIRDELNER